MRYAKKLNLEVPDFVHALRRTTRVIGADGSKARGEVLRRYVTRADREKILSIFPPSIAIADKAIFISRVDPIGPHTHTDDKCVINLYLQASNAETVFYDGKIVALKDPDLRNASRYTAPDETLLKPVESFKASSGDVWVLNTEKPHAVVANGSFEERWVVQIYLTTPFSEVLQQLGGS
jgi:hypothetical protein